ncbi:uncharacterized protein BO95DRAFT_475575 [Aspergillus brunneoviolaceus CBS 621.78]|uniref:Uncharacterized protein n=1 Tax=Aspergillus brunneoviolaceus CBS 621.78 TaxID=1450534 RepID=A0ACD1G0Z9_9EURO|nr:hypothetical protein BO95DRAFT_475575 [Aspergillus brunneoviolaceus CBS 621.78]RAH42843.1 hypothetical protein BO95DRAFT_475575 [Aspergillus brunneoviolaceus CBS 621.78]
MYMMLFIALLFGLAAGQDATTSGQWLITLNTSIFWPTSTDYFYGPTTGPDAAVVTCNAAWIEWASRSLELRSLGPTATIESTGSYATSAGACRTSVTPEAWSNTHTGPLTTLCDGIPRAVGPRETATEYFPDASSPCSEGYQTFTETETLYRNPPDPTPDCTLQTSECIPIWSTYSELEASYYETITAAPPGDTNSPIPPYSCPSTTRSYPEENPCSACHFLPGTATLFYWPVTTADGDLCQQNGTTVSPSGPSTAIVNGETFISPTVYLSFTSIYAWSNRRAHPGSQCGVSHSNEILSINPATLSSVRNHRNAKYPTVGTAYPFNFAEFMPHHLEGRGNDNDTQSLIPWPQYRGGQQCPLYDPSCTIIRDDYRPWVLLPEEVRQIDPGWSVCDESWYIPPVTMVPLDREVITVTATPEPDADADAEVQGFLRVAAVPGEGPAAATPAPTELGW